MLEDLSLINDTTLLRTMSLQLQHKGNTSVNQMFKFVFICSAMSLKASLGTLEADLLNSPAEC